MGRILDDSEQELFDMVASDQNEAAGIDVNFYSNNKKLGTKDPLYGEYVNRHIDGPYRVPAWVKWPPQNPFSTEHGFTLEFDGECVISRIHLENKKAPFPSEGDIIEMWRTPYHDANSMGKGMFFDVIKVNNDGHINDTPTFVQFRLTLKRRPQFGAERKIDPP